MREDWVIWRGKQSRSTARWIARRGEFKHIELKSQTLG